MASVMSLSAIRARGLGQRCDLGRSHTPRCRDSGKQYVIDDLFYTGY